MFFYGVFTKAGSAVAGWVNENYPKKETVKPRVYHKYIKQEDKDRLYPELNKEEEETDPAEETPTDQEKDQNPTDENTETNTVDENPDEDPLGEV